MKRARAAAGAGFAMLALACSVSPQPVAPSARHGQGMPTMPALERLTESVLEDAARRTGLPRARLVVERAETVTWADGSLGCPQPGMNYTMALVPGYRIRIRAGEQLLDYHAGRGGHFVLCPTGQSVAPAGDTAV